MIRTFFVAALILLSSLPAHADVAPSGGGGDHKCGCATAQPAAGWVWGTALLAGLVLRRRRD